MVSLLIYLGYVLSVLVGMIVARLSFSFIISMEYKKERIFGPVIKSFIIAGVLMVPFLGIESYNSIQLQFITACVVIGFLIQRESSIRNIKEYIKTEEKFAKEDDTI